MPSQIQHERDLHDPALSALLQDSFAHDPALIASPGRTERIMRVVLTASRRRRWAGWLSIGWTAGAAATAAAMLLLIVGLARTPLVEMTPIATTPIIAPTPPARQAVAPAVPPSILDAQLPPPSASRNEPAWEWTSPTPTIKEQSAPPWVKSEDEIAVQPSAKTSPEIAEDHSAGAAAALNTAGAAAYAAGDYESAYQAYAASYETLPMPDTILRSGQALQRLAQEELTTKG